MTLHTILNGRHVTIDRFNTGIGPGVWVWAGSVDNDPRKRDKYASAATPPDRQLVIGISTADGLRQVLAQLDDLTKEAS